MRDNTIISRSQLRQADGFVLVAVLWLTATLSALALVYALYVKSTASGIGAHEGRLRAELATQAALELAALRLESVPPAARPHSGRFSFRLGDGANVTVDFSAEASRIDLNTAPKELLETFLSAISPDDRRVPDYVNAIIAWRTGRLNSGSNGGSGPQPRKFRSPTELAAVPSLPPELVRRALPFVTVYSGMPKVDIWSAPADALHFLPGLQPDRIPEILAEVGAPNPDPQRLASLLGPAQAYVSSEPPRAIRVRAHSELTNGFKSATEAVILLFDQGREPYSVLTWNEDPYAQL